MASALEGRRQRARVSITCATCSIAFEVEHHRAATAKFCSRACQGLARRGATIPCLNCGAPIHRAPAQSPARYCSMACRSAARRVDVTCEHCGNRVSQKASEASARRFCSRKCMQAAWGCRRCAKLVPTVRREGGDAYCSDRCELGALLDEEASRTGELRAYCFACRQILPAGAFHRDKTGRHGLSPRCKECTQAKYEASKDAYRLRRYRYDAAPGGQIIAFTAEQRTQRFAMWGGRCWKCGIAGATEEDHVKPISKGGWHCLSNLRPICQPCNVRKRNLWPLTGEWLVSGLHRRNLVAGSDRERRREREPRRSYRCPQCGKTDVIRACDARSRTYCSRECAYAAKIPSKLALTCPRCGSTFEVHDNKWGRQRKFCSPACANPSRGIRRRVSPSSDQLCLYGS
jgi:5-methylcytosine-specific restriction endonuclease McrA/endogenous inhibitor of DNA gyrase (YacG/DUF329 family)